MIMTVCGKQYYSRPVGEKFVDDGVTYEVVVARNRASRQGYCEGCAFVNFSHGDCRTIRDQVAGECLSFLRGDDLRVKFVEIKGDNYQI